MGIMVCGETDVCYLYVVVSTLAVRVVFGCYRTMHGSHLVARGYRTRTYKQGEPSIRINKRGMVILYSTVDVECICPAFMSYFLLTTIVRVVLALGSWRSF